MKNEAAEQIEDEKMMNDKENNLPFMDLEQAHQRLGHRSFRSLLTGSTNQIWHDYQLRPEKESFWNTCAISTRQVANRNLNDPNKATRNFERIFLDIIKCPSKQSLSISTSYSYLLFGVDQKTQFTFIEGLTNKETSTILLNLDKIFTRLKFCSKHPIQVHHIRGDADSVFNSAQFGQYAEKHNISVSLAAPHHQEQNGVCERTWQTVNNIGRKFLVHARLSNHFYFFSRKYAVEIVNILPTKHITDDQGKITTPYFLVIGRKPRIGKFKTFGCPVSFKRYEPIFQGNIITNQQQLQQASITLAFWQILQDI